VPLTSSLGRLFDAVAALAGVRYLARYEGQAALELEMQMEVEEVQEDNGEIYFFDIVDTDDTFIISPDKAIFHILKDKESGLSASRISWKFHAGLVRLFLDIARKVRKQTGIDCVVLSGGCFLNRFLLENLMQELEKEHFEVLTHTQVPTNDGCIALGQAVVGIERLEKEKNNLD